MAFDISGPNLTNFMGGATVASGDSSATVVGPINLLGYQLKSFTLMNQHATLTLSGAIVQVNQDHGGYEAGTQLTGGGTGPPPNPGMWENYDTTTFQSLAATTARSVAMPANSLFRWWRITATNNQTPSLGVSGWCYAASQG